MVIMSEIQEVTRDTFDREVLAATLPVVVEFYAAHCGECSALEPTLQRLAAKYDGRIKFVRVDVDAEPVLAARHMINAVPTLMLFKNATDVDDDIDFVTPGNLEGELEHACENSSPPTAGCGRR
jgi:thioredoxin 1